jgi:acetyl esterase/lipase
MGASKKFIAIGTANNIRQIACALARILQTSRKSCTTSAMKPTLPSTLFALAAALVLSFGPARADEEVPAPSVDDALKVWHNISYVPGSSDYRQKMDVSVPKSGGPYPMVVWIHGGAWMHGSKENPPVQPLLKKDYAVASINYRLSTQAPFPAQIQDCKTAIRFLRANAKQFNIDPKRIGVWGMSAGGHLAAMLATTGGIKEFEGKGYNNISSNVQAASDYCGPTDLAHIRVQTQGPKWKLSFEDPGSPMHILLAKDVREERLNWASPAVYVTKDDAPLQIIHGDKDDVVPIDQSTTLYEQYKKGKLQSEYTRVGGAGHNLFSRPNVERTLSFFDRYLK